MYVYMYIYIYIYLSLKRYFATNCNLIRFRNLEINGALPVNHAERLLALISVFSVLLQERVSFKKLNVTTLSLRLGRDLQFCHRGYLICCSCI